MAMENGAPPGLKTVSPIKNGDITASYVSFKQFLFSPLFGEDSHFD